MGIWVSTWMGIGEIEAAEEENNSDRRKKYQCKFCLELREDCARGRANCWSHQQPENQ